MGKEVFYAAAIVISGFVWFSNSNFLKTLAPASDNAGNLVRTFSKEEEVKAIAQEKELIAEFIKPVAVKKAAKKRQIVVPHVIVPDDETTKYVKRYAIMAHREYEKSGVPASVTLAQGILESNIGTSLLAVKANNHFGRKCQLKHRDNRHCLNYHDDKPTDRFKKYATVGSSFADHSAVVTSGRYEPLTASKPCSWLLARPTKHKESVNKIKWQMAVRSWNKPHIRWAYGLDALGYATDEKYASNLIRIINKYKLTRYDD
jgi:flagellum-specific peptidoglycan hydrolase FlgJ